MRHQRSILDRDVVFKGASDGDAVCVDYYYTQDAFVRADPLQCFLDHCYVPHVGEAARLVSSISLSPVKHRPELLQSLTSEICSLLGICWRYKFC